MERNKSLFVPLITHFDLSSPAGMCGRDPQFMSDFINLFIATTPPDIEQIKELRNEGNGQDIGEILHMIKSTLELFGMMHIHGEIKSAEKAHGLRIYFGICITENNNFSSRIIHSMIHRCCFSSSFIFM